MDNSIAFWDKIETEYNKHYDPYAELYCDHCEAEKEDLCICKED